ncbi:reverse transcriptase domain, Ribonuclease H-like domain protein [Artemisia annua]|uniref:Reverse transcriptase domain, Ribonuclease H-like domain protein n=1 Tax=Artemisia annua TaxID=35608 RepID=A0A2U1M9I8_ARTAN|nr:reverse transcriptase domain, Ribonuclease H-like domain protein [Artemisia annua]
MEATYKQKFEKYYNSRVRPLTFKPGKYVLRLNSASKAEYQGKLGPIWEGPYVVAEAYGNGAYKLATLFGEEVDRTWNGVKVVTGVDVGGDKRRFCCLRFKKGDLGMMTQWRERKKTKMVFGFVSSPQKGSRLGLFWVEFTEKRKNKMVVLVLRRKKYGFGFWVAWPFEEEERKKEKYGFMLDDCLRDAPYIPSTVWNRTSANRDQGKADKLISPNK